MGEGDEEPCEAWGEGVKRVGVGPALEDEGKDKSKDEDEDEGDITVAAAACCKGVEEEGG